jgi:hypothetical protein
MDLSVSFAGHLRGIVIAGSLAALALALGFVTLAMNQSSSSASTHTVLSLKARHAASHHAKTATTKGGAHVLKRKAPNVHLVAALKAGLPRSVAKGLAAHPVTVVALTSADDPVAGLSMLESRAGAALAGASFVPVSVDRDGGDASALTALLGKLPVAPATLVYTRPGTLFVLMPGFNDKTTVEQAARNAAPAPGTPVAPAAPTPTVSTPSTVAPAAA